MPEVQQLSDFPLLLLLIRVLARIFCSCCFTAAKSPRHCQPEMVALFLLNVLGHISLKNPPTTSPKPQTSSR